MIGIHPPSYNKLKTGQLGPSGIGYKLLNDGNYDVEKKIFKKLCKSFRQSRYQFKKLVLDELKKKYQTLKEIIDFYKNNNDVIFLIL